MTQAQPRFDEALDSIEQAILPNLSLLLEAAVDAAETSQPGIDSGERAAELRNLARQIGDLTALVVAARPQPAAAEEVRIPA